MIDSGRGAPGPDSIGTNGISGTQRGSGLFGTLMGLAVFMLLLMTAVQVLFNLYATTVVSSAALDAARLVAGYDSAPSRCGATAEADAAFMARLGAYTERGTASLAWTCDNPDVVRVVVHAEHPTILPSRVRGLTGLGSMQRTIEVRVEDLR